MKVLEINSVLREESSLYYINRYSGNAVLDVLSQQVSLPLKFSVEITPFGQRNIDLEFQKFDLNYPIMPVTKSVKTFIEQLSLNGELP